MSESSGKPVLHPPAVSTIRPPAVSTIRPPAVSTMRPPAVSTMRPPPAPKRSAFLSPLAAAVQFPTRGPPQHGAGDQQGGLMLHFNSAMLPHAPSPRASELPGVTGSALLSEKQPQAMTAAIQPVTVPGKASHAIRPLPQASTLQPVQQLITPFAGHFGLPKARTPLTGAPSTVLQPPPVKSLLPETSPPTVAARPPPQSVRPTTASPLPPLTSSLHDMQKLHPTTIVAPEETSKQKSPPLRPSNMFRPFVKSSSLSSPKTPSSFKTPPSITSSSSSPLKRKHSSLFGKTQHRGAEPRTFFTATRTTPQKDLQHSLTALHKSQPSQQSSFAKNASRSQTRSPPVSTDASRFSSTLSFQEGTPLQSVPPLPSREGHDGAAEALRQFLQSKGWFPGIFDGSNPPSQFYALEHHVNHIPFGHIVATPFDIDRATACDSIGPPLVVCVSRTVPTTAAEKRNLSPPRAAVSHKRPSTSTSLGPHPKKSATRGQRVEDAEERTLSQWLSRLSRYDGVEVVYVSPRFFTVNSQKLFGELPLSLSSLFLCAWNTLMTTSQEQTITLLGNLNLDTSIQTPGPAEKILQAAIFLGGGCPLKARDNLVPLILAAAKTLRSFSCIAPSAHSRLYSCRALTRWQLDFDSDGDLRGLRLFSRLLDTLSFSTCTQPAVPIPPDVQLFHSSIMALRRKARLQRFTTDNSYGCELPFQTVLFVHESWEKYLVDPFLPEVRCVCRLKHELDGLWDAVSGGYNVVPRSRYSEERDREEEEVADWLHALTLIGLDTEQIRSVIRHLLAGALLTHGILTSETRFALIAEFLGLSTDAMLTTMETCYRLFLAQAERTSMISSMASETIASHVARHVAGYIHRQLYATLCYRIESRIKTFLPTATSIAGATNEFGMPRALHLIDPPTNIDADVHREFGTLACLLSQSVADAHCFLRVNQLRYLLRTQGNAERSLSHCMMAGISLDKSKLNTAGFGLGSAPNSDDVVASFLLDKGLFTWASQKSRSEQEFEAWFDHIAHADDTVNVDELEDDYITTAAQKVFLKIQRLETGPHVPIRFQDAVMAYDWSIANLALATLPQGPSEAVLQLMLSRGTLSRVLQWQKPLESSTLTFNEYHRVIDAMADVLQPCLHTLPYVAFRGTVAEDIHRLDRCSKSLRASVEWERHGFAVWLPSEVFIKQFSVLLPQLQRKKQRSSNVVDLLLSVDGMTEADLACGWAGLLVTGRGYRILHSAQNQKRRLQLLKTNEDVEEIASPTKSLSPNRSAARNASSHVLQTDTTPSSGSGRLVSFSSPSSSRSSSMSPRAVDGRNSSKRAPVVEPTHNTVVNISLSSPPSIELPSPAGQCPVNRDALVGIPPRYFPKREPSKPLTAEEIRTLLIQRHGETEQVRRLLEFSDQDLLDMFSTSWKQVNIKGSWRGLVYCSKKASASIDRIMQLQASLGSRSAAKDVADTMHNFVAGFCEPLLGNETTALDLLVCTADEDYTRAASALERSKGSHKCLPLEVCAEGHVQAHPDGTDVSGTLQMSATTNPKPHFPVNRCLQRLQVGHHVIAQSTTTIQNASSFQNESTDLQEGSLNLPPLANVSSESTPPSSPPQDTFASSENVVDDSPHARNNAVSRSARKTARKTSERCAFVSTTRSTL